MTYFNTVQNVLKTKNCATMLPKAWEKLNILEAAHPGVKSAPRWKDLCALDPRMPACWNNVVANSCVYRVHHCGKHGLKRDSF